MVCIWTSSAAVSGSVSAAVHSMRCLASSSKLDTVAGSLEFLAEDEMRPSVAASPPRRRGRGSRRKRSRSFSLFIIEHLPGFPLLQIQLVYGDSRLESKYFGFPISAEY